MGISCSSCSIQSFPCGLNRCSVAQIDNGQQFTLFITSSPQRRPIMIGYCTRTLINVSPDCNLGPALWTRVRRVPDLHYYCYDVTGRVEYAPELMAATASIKSRGLIGAWKLHSAREMTEGANRSWLP